MHKPIPSNLTTCRYSYCPNCDEEFADAMIFEELTDLKCDACNATIVFNRYLIDISRIPFVIHNIQQAYDKEVSHLCFLEEIREQDLGIYFKEEADHVKSVESLLLTELATICPNCMK